jgi:hypothetical protein
MEQLTQVQHKLAEALYRQAAPGAGAGAPGGEAGGAGPSGGDSTGDVIDAEVVDDGKK